MCARNSKLTITEAMATLGYSIHNYYYSCWKRDIRAANEVLSKCLVVDKSTVPGFIPNKTHCKIHTSKVGCLELYAKELQEKVSMWVWILSSNRPQLPASKTAAVQQSVKRIGLSYCAPTHVAQKHHKETELLANVHAFIEMVCGRVKLIHPEAVANMDQTPIPIPFCCMSNKTLSVKGAKIIQLLTP